MAMDFDGIVIVGGGIAGLATALALHRVGIASIVLERAKSLRTTGSALGMWDNAWKALDALGIGDTLRQHHLLLQGSQLVSVSAGTTKDILLQTHTNNNRGHELRCVKRSLVLEVLAAALPPDVIKFNCTIVNVRQTLRSQLSSEIQLEDGTLIRAKGVIGCDGVKSVVAQSVLGLPPPSSSPRCVVRGLATYAGGHHFPPTRQINFSNGVMFGLIPVNMTEVYWFISSSSTPPDYSEISHDPLRISNWGESVLKDFPEQIREVVKRTGSDDLNIAFLMFRWPWSVLTGTLSNGTVTAAGDAMHPMTPDLAQGACSALEDAIALARCLAEAEAETDKHRNERQRIEEALKQYTHERRWRWLRLMSQAYVTGYVQQGSSPFLRFIRDNIILKISLPDHTNYDCGTLPNRKTA